MRERRSGSTLRALWYMTALAFRADTPRAVAALVIAGVGASGSPLAAFLLSRVVGSALRHDVGDAYGFAIALALVMFVTFAAQLVRLDLRFRMEEATELLIDRELVLLAAGVPGLMQYERPEHLDRLELLRQQRRSLGGSVGALLENFGTLVSIVTTTGLLAAVDPRLLLLPLFGIPSIAASGWQQRVTQRLENETAEKKRLAKHLFTLATSGPPAKELRVFGLRDELQRRHADLTEAVDARFDATALRTTFVSTGAWLLFAVAYVGALALVVDNAVHGRAGAADVILVVTLAGQVNQQVGSVYMMVGWLFETLKTVGRYLKLADDAAAESAPITDPQPAPAVLTHGIDFAGVSFSYPGTDATVLRDVNLHLPAGSTVAVVGDNGAGKSTLMKLLCGFYDATSGVVTVDGVDLRRIPPDEWRARLSAGFQDFARLELVARETVGVGDLPFIADDGVVHGALARAAATDVAGALANGLETQVGRQFDGGVELSGGQWQKLALGRAMMRARPLLLVLDEPTAALDADTEHALFERYAGAARDVAAETGGITILVSHRFSTVRMADLIVVVDNGTVTEFGSHDALMARAGTYAELYELQARAYR